jgi:hypothetical protein
MSAPINICQQCKPYRQRPCSGKCVCTLDGHDIIEHAMAHYCPDKRYGDGVKPAGWDDACPRCGGAHLIASCPIPPDYEATPENATQGRCCS